MKRALILNAVNTRIGGVLIRGKKGTAKSTAVRSLAALLPEVAVVRGCPYSCHPENPQPLCSHGKETSPVTRQVRIVDLPVGATEDRLVGSLDIESAIRTGSRSFEPGLIAATHRGILYVDEVNLLNDHLVDVLLDAAAMGRNYVEREGISVSHAAEFILVGTMNPEEGDLRPQLLDRFGLAVEVDSAFTPGGTPRGRQAPHRLRVRPLRLHGRLAGVRGRRAASASSAASSYWAASPYPMTYWNSSPASAPSTRLTASAPTS